MDFRSPEFAALLTCTANTAETIVLAKLVISWSVGDGLLDVGAQDWVGISANRIGHVVILVDHVSVLIHIPGEGIQYLFNLI